MIKSKIKLGIVFYGNKDQMRANQDQFSFLKAELADFRLKKYDLHRGEIATLLTDYSNRKLNYVLKNSYGRGNEAQIESILEFYGIPFLGSGSAATIIGTNKYLSKLIFRQKKIPVIKDFSVSRSNIDRNIKSFPIPCVIKDIAGTDSRGIYLVQKKEQFGKILNQALKFHENVIVEKYISNSYEVTCFVTGSNQLYAYEPVGVVTSRGWYNPSAKDRGLVKYEIPSKLSTFIRKQIKNYAKLAHRAVGCNMFSRSDFLVKGGSVYLLEVDVHPGFRAFSPTTLSVHQQSGSLNNLFMSFISELK